MENPAAAYIGKSGGLCGPSGPCPSGPPAPFEVGPFEVGGGPSGLRPSGGLTA